MRYWNQVLCDANALDHTPMANRENRTSGEQAGPGRTARAFAIVHIAMSDAVNAIVKRYDIYTGLAPVPNDASVDAALAQAAHDTLVALYPSQTPIFDQKLADDLGQIRDGRVKQAGLEVGKQAAAAILELRKADGSQHAKPQVGTGPGQFPVSDAPGKWRSDPQTAMSTARSETGKSRRVRGRSPIIRRLARLCLASVVSAGVGASDRYKSLAYLPLFLGADYSESTTKNHWQKILELF